MQDSTLIRLNTVLLNGCLTDPNGLKREEIIRYNEETPFTHYQICEYGRLRIKETSVFCWPDVIRFEVSKQINEWDWEHKELMIPGPRLGGPVRMEIRGPSVVLIFIDPYGKVIEDSYESVFIFLTKLGEKNGWHSYVEGLLDLEVKYIGQTEIADNGYLRFKNHSNMQEEMADMIKKRPEKEIVVKLLNFGEPSAEFTTGNLFSFNTSEHEILDNIPKDQWVTVIEGALIHYFNTEEYNTHYVKNFPSSKHMYKYFYDKNITSIVIELQEEYMVYKTSRKGDKPKRVRLIEYSFDKNHVYPAKLNNENQIPDELYEELTGSLKKKFSS